MQYHHHGTLVSDGQSLNGFVYGCGDSVVIYDDGRNEVANDEVHVLNLRNGQSIVVPLRVVCWVPAYSEERHGRTFLFTLYGHRFSLPPDSDGLQECTGSRAIQVSFGSTGRLDYSHTILTEEKLSRCAHRLQESEKQAYFALQWNLVTTCPLQTDVDTSSERSSSVALTRSSTTSPATPSSAVDMDMDTFGLLLRRDSAVDLSYQSAGVDGQALYGNVENNTLHGDPSGMFSPLGFFNSHFSFKNEARPQPSGSLSPLGTEHRAVSPWLEPYETYLDPGLVSLNDVSALQVNCMYLPPANPASTGTSADQTQASQHEDNSVDWTSSVGLAVPTPGHAWNPIQFSQSVGASQQPNCGPSVPMQSLVEGPPQIQQHTTTTLPVPTADSQHYEAQRLSTGPPAPFFYRVQQSNERTVGLTASPESTGRTTSQRQKRRRSSDRGSPKARRARRSRHKSPDPPPQYRPFRPELIADFFSRQAQLHIEPLEARCREQLGSSSVGPDEAVPSKILSEALDHIRKAHTDVVKILGTLRSVTQEPFELREARIRQDADKIIAVIQNIRNAALEGEELAEQDVRSLKQRVEAFVTYVEWVRELDKTGQDAEAERNSTKDDSKGSSDSGAVAGSSTGGVEDGSNSGNTAAVTSTTFSAAASCPPGPTQSHQPAYWLTNTPASGAMEYGAPELWLSVPSPSQLPPTPDSHAAYPPPPPAGAIPHGSPLSAGPQAPLYHPGYPANFEANVGPALMVPPVSTFESVPTTSTLHTGAAPPPLVTEARLPPSPTTFHPASVSPLGGMSPLSSPSLMVPPSGRRSSLVERRLNRP
ncbi:hypothetical protein ACRALDRAFT_1068289 [Sodiomyces alcalophilus JCM 7366]|uniref:uncharacterized protein n=1 Tax=Sodiomyces alcalophilus JCM 7366 TaxID=591952 RepID=UPI0039B63FB4